jgi:hypothetical protein
MFGLSRSSGPFGSSGLFGFSSLFGLLITRALLTRETRQTSQLDKQVQT